MSTSESDDDDDLSHHRQKHHQQQHLTKENNDRKLAVEDEKNPIRIGLKGFLRSSLDDHRYNVKHLLRIEIARDFSSAPSLYNKESLEEHLQRTSLESARTGLDGQSNASGSTEEGIKGKTLSQITKSPFLHFQDEKSFFQRIEPLSIASASSDPGSWRQDMNKKKDVSGQHPIFKKNVNIYMHKEKVSKVSGAIKLVLVEHKIVIPARRIPSVEAVQRYTEYTTLKSNVVVEDDDCMRYIPYLGEEKVGNEVIRRELEEAYTDKTTKNHLEARRLERASQSVDFIRDFLSFQGLKPADIQSYLFLRIPSDWSNERKLLHEQALPEDYDPDTIEYKNLKLACKSIDESKLKRAEEVIEVFRSTTSVSLWEVIKLLNEREKPFKKSPPKKDLDDPTVQSEFSVESYASLNCKFCGMHNCHLHNNRFYESFLTQDDSADSTVKSDQNQSSNSDPESVRKAASRVKPKTARKTAADIPAKLPKTPMVMTPQTNRSSEARLEKLPLGISEKKAKNVPGIMLECFDDGESCSKNCFKKMTKERAIEVEKEARSSHTWSQLMECLFTTSSAVLFSNSRAACLLCSIINKPCEELYIRLKLRNLVPKPSLEQRPSLLNISSRPPSDDGSVTNGNGNGNKGQRRGPKSLYPADCSKSSTHTERPNFKPCEHAGPCIDKNTCYCVKFKVNCEKFCGCPGDCNRRWKGCTCVNGKICTMAKCACYSAQRECDPDICKGCGASEQLDPANRTNEEVAEKCCRNVPLQKGVTRRTLLGKTILGVKGFGLFTGENIKKNNFIGEYKGEIVSNNEAERRGKIQDLRECSYLFTLNMAQVIDATRAGNKFRFVNHSSSKPNVYPKVSLANGCHRIGFYSKRDINAGEELFFDYGLGFQEQTVKFVAYEPSEQIVKNGVANGPLKRKKHALINTTTKKSTTATLAINGMNLNGMLSADGSRQISRTPTISEVGSDFRTATTETSSFDVDSASEERHSKGGVEYSDESTDVDYRDNRDSDGQVGTSANSRSEATTKKPRRKKRKKIITRR